MLHRTLQRVLKRMVTFVVVFLLVWVAPMADRIFPLVTDRPSPYWLALLHLMSLCSMGFVNCVVWMLSRPVQQLLTRTYSGHSVSTNGYLPFLTGDDVPANLCASGHLAHTPGSAGSGSLSSVGRVNRR